MNKEKDCQKNIEKKNNAPKGTSKMRKRKKKEKPKIKRNQESVNFKLVLCRHPNESR